MQANPTHANEYSPARWQESTDPETNLLHFKPLYARAISGIQHTLAHLHNKAPEEGWQGRTIRILAAVMAVTGYIGAIPIALVETATALALAAVTTAFHFLTEKQYALLEKISAKTLAYALNNIILIAAKIILLAKHWGSPLLLPRYRTLSTLTDQSAYLLAAAGAQSLTAWAFYGTDSEKIPLRLLQLATESLPHAIEAVFNSLVRDFAPVDYQPINIREFITNHLSSEDSELINNINISRFLTEESYRNQFIPILQNLLIASNLIVDGESFSPETNDIMFNIYTAEEKQYQTHLKDCVKKAIKKMMEDDRARFLDPNDNVELGKASILNLYPQTTIPIAYIAQLTELEEEFDCPEKFKHNDLKSYNFPSRRERVTAARIVYSNLSKNDKELLFERLLKGSDFDLGERCTDKNEKEWNSFYNEITSLGNDLHQGKLLTVLTYNLQEHDFSSESHFGKGWMEAVNELDNASS